MAGKYELSAARNGQYFFTLKAANGEVVLKSEMYTSKSSALNGIASVRNNAANDERYERKTSKNDQPYFVLKAANHQVIGNSEMYSSTSSMERGIASVKSNGPSSSVEDLTT